MTDEAKIYQGRYKSLPISIAGGSIEGGKKAIVRQFPNKNSQSVETLGLKPRKYSLDVIINDKVNQDYFSYRDSLIATLESDGAGVLIHPLYGRIEDVIAVNYSINERFAEFGGATVSVNFEVDKNTGIPQASANVSTQLATLNQSVQDAINADIAQNFNVTPGFFGNFTAAAEKITSIIDSTAGATAFIGEQSDSINEFSAEIGSLSASVNSLVTNPIALADSITGLFDSVNGLYASSDATLDTVKGFFNFGNSDSEITETTAGKAERNKNNTTLNNAVKTSSLGYAYVSASEKEYLTTDDINDELADLELQYQSVLSASESVVEALTDLRELSLKVFDEKRQNAKQITDIYEKRTSCRLLSFNYYGDDSLGQNIADLNTIDDVSFVSGEVKVFTA